MLVSFASQVLHSKSKTTVSPEVDPQEEEVLGASLPGCSLWSFVFLFG